MFLNLYPNSLIKSTSCESIRGTIQSKPNKRNYVKIVIFIIVIFNNNYRKLYSGQKSGGNIMNKFKLFVALMIVGFLGFQCISIGQTLDVPKGQMQMYQSINLSI